MYEEDSEGNCVPVITLEVMSDSSNTDSCDDTASNERRQNDCEQERVGSHFLSDKQDEGKSEAGDCREKDQDSTKEPQRVKLESCEYRTRSDGSVICKLCGEILQSRTHWYRHKYKLHVPSNLHPAPLYQCEQCTVFFKSRKGYLGHLSSRHSQPTSDINPALPVAQTETTKEPQQHLQQQQFLQHNLTEELDPDLSIPKSSLSTYQSLTSKPNPSKTAEQSKLLRNNRSTTAVANPVSSIDLEERRIREEKLVTDIIDRVRRECEAQGAGGPARRGYSRRPTAMHT